jgi:hypothetical protein
LSKELPPLSQVRFFQAMSEQEFEHESFAINPDALRITGSFKVMLYSVGLLVTAQLSGGSL